MVDLVLWVQEKEDSKNFFIDLAFFPMRNFKRRFTETAPLYFDFYAFTVPPGETYTSFEKLFLPFDLPTWMMFLAVFLIAYTFIVFISLFSDQGVADFMFGEKVNTPAINVFVIFMGLGVVRLPRKNFPRFLVMVFLLYCLIMRFDIKTHILL